MAGDLLCTPGRDGTAGALPASFRAGEAPWRSCALDRISGRGAIRSAVLSGSTRLSSHEYPSTTQRKVASDWSATRSSPMGGAVGRNRNGQAVAHHRQRGVVGPGHRERATLSYVTRRLFQMEGHFRAQSVIAQTIIGHGPQCNLSIS